MPYTRCRQTAAGAFATGLVGTIGYTLWSSAVPPVIIAARTTAGIGEIGATTIYQSNVTHPDNFDGSLVWDDTVNFANETVNPTLLDLTQPVPTTNTAQTLGDAMNAARAQGFGKWTLVGTALTMYAADGTTVVRTFTLDSATVPTSRA